MNDVAKRPDVERILRQLKNFQRDTVEHVFRRLYLDTAATPRFLVADEVGLGKTLVARGVIARTIDHLWDQVDRIDVVYICSNADIARQNINKLNVMGNKDLAMASRITLLPTSIQDLSGNKVNFVSFTPGTSFELKSSLGVMRERALLYWLLDAAWNLSGSGPLNLLQGYVQDKDAFRNYINWFRSQVKVDPGVTQAFATELGRQVAADQVAGVPDLRSRFDDLCQRFRYPRSQPPAADARDRARLVGDLRGLLARTCLHSLEPDLIILDEFQRFKHLLSGDEEASQLAQHLFSYADAASHARVLLLSATPYKMYTLADESGSDDHYRDFLQTLQFLVPDPAAQAELETLLHEYRRGLYRLGAAGGDTAPALPELKQQLEARLRQVMVRTERLSVTADRNGMLTQVLPPIPRLEAGDLRAYVALQEVAAALGQGDVTTYWKTAPYLLNFMDNYKLKQEWERSLADPAAAATVAQLLQDDRGALFPWDQWAAYEAVDPGNARLRVLMADVIDAGAWQLLWVPPSLPYYALGGPYGDERARRLTKRLVFSAWQVVPKVVAALLSFEAERRMIRSFEAEPENSAEARRRRRPLLRFARTDERLTGMPVLGLLFPSLALAELADPLDLARVLAGPGGEPPALGDVVALARRRIGERLAAVLAAHAAATATGPEDEAWYWAAPILLDLEAHPEATRHWWANPELAAAWSQGDGPVDAEETEEASRWAEHVDQARELVAGRLRLGLPPADLTEVLAQMAIAAPGVTALRALRRQVGAGGEVGAAGQALQTHAARVAWAFRSLFNLPEVTALIRGLNRAEPYWRRVLEYCLLGGLQSTLDEYAHLLYDLKGLANEDPGEAAAQMANLISEAVTLRTATLVADEFVQAPEGQVETRKHRLRVRFALRYGDERSEQGGPVARATQVQSAFNSPFWPFVLVTTSKGQEGLDFHMYAYAVVHWDLPANPVDLEQREGRVHRFKGHAVRRNVAATHGPGVLAPRPDGAKGGDPWAEAFRLAEAGRPAGESDLVPFWMYPVEGGARIERHVPALPLSRDLERLTQLRRSLALYRMVFGQPRQEDLLAYLLERLPAEEAQEVLGRVRIDLGPG